MSTLRRLSYAALAVAFLHIVFGAIVRISGSGMGCGDHWPKCYGYWFPPFTRPDLVIEVLHRYFAATLITVVVALLAVAVLRRRTPGVGGRGGVLRAAALASGLVTFAAAFGAVTVRFANAPWATVTHKGIAASLLAALAAATVRAGGLGAARAAIAPTAARTARAAYSAALLAIVAVLLGGFTAKIAAGAVACRGFPFCGEGSLGGGAQHVQLTHRVVAYLLAIHLIGLAIAVTRRREPGPVAVAARAAAGVVVLQIALGAAMVLGGFHPVVRSLHQATGIMLWLATFVMAYLARRGTTPGRDPAPIGGRPLAPRPTGTPTPVTALGRATRDAAPRPPARASAAATPELPAAAREVIEELAVANGAPMRAHAAARHGGMFTPRLLQLVGAPRRVVHAEPLRRGTPRDARRGRDTAERPFRVIDGRTRPTGDALPPPSPRRGAPISGRATPTAGLAALPALPAPECRVDDGPGFDLAHAGPEFTIIVWAETPAPATGDVSSPVGPPELDSGHHVLRRFAESFAATPPAAVPVVREMVVWGDEPMSGEPTIDEPMLAALLGDALLAEVGAPSVAAVRRARRYSVALLVARGADL